MPLRCKNCSGLKYLGEPYHAFGLWFVDITCLTCGHSKDIAVDDLRNLLKRLEQHVSIERRKREECSQIN